jgi:hypothetical protein
LPMSAGFLLSDSIRTCQVCPKRFGSLTKSPPPETWSVLKTSLNETPWRAALARSTSM